MSQVNFGSGHGSAAAATHTVTDPSAAYINGLLNAGEGGGGHDTFSLGGGHEGKKHNPLVKLAVAIAGIGLALKFGAKKKIMGLFSALRQRIPSMAKKAAQTVEEKGEQAVGTVLKAEA